MSAAVLQSGCGGAAARPETPSGAGPAVVAAGDAATAAALLGMESGPTEFVPWEGAPARAKGWTRTASASGVAAREWKVLRAETGSGKPVEELSLRELENGSVALVSRVDHVERVTVEFEPPMVIMPAVLSPGEEGAHEQTFRMIVRPIGNRNQIKAQGDAANRVTYAGQQEIDTPNGRVRARLVRSELTAALAPSMVRNVMDQWFLDGVGLIAERSHERTMVMGVTIRDNRESWLRAELPTPEPAPN